MQTIEYIEDQVSSFIQPYYTEHGRRHRLKLERILRFGTGVYPQMKKLVYISFIGILLSMVVISPVVAFSPVTPSIQGSEGAAISHAGYFPHAAQNYTGQGRFVRSADTFFPFKTTVSSTRFPSYTITRTGTTRTFTESDNGKSIALTRGQVIKVQLNENPTTGYRWQPTVSSGIQITDDTYVASTSGRLGAGGIHTWTLKITGTGIQHFSADYKRSWEPGSEDSYSIQFVVA